MKATVKGITIELVQGDITDLEVDAIVNAANEQLILGAGVAGAIRRKGGPSIQEECLAIGSCEVGSAVITGAGMLKARYVIHAVGPCMGDGDEARKLASAVRASLGLAEAHGLHSIALPAISTGVFGCPLESCAQASLRATLDYMLEKPASLRHIIVCLYDDHAFGVFAAELSRKLGLLNSEAE
ncbi:MAG: macro domain-containing protein [Anaerolineae bacterium]|nr:macro domain-containing protein [Anaerolineae bacterium]